MANPFVHVELNTTDPKQAKEFYGELFDWDLQDQDMGQHGTYTMVKPGEGTGGGIMKHPVPGAPSMWLAYVLVDDLAATTKKAKQMGAKIVQENVPVANMGAFSIITDPTGAMLGLWQTAKKM